MDSKKDKEYLLRFLSLILFLLLIALVICVLALWACNFTRTFAIANTGAALGIFLASISARSAKNAFDKTLVVLGLA